MSAEELLLQASKEAIEKLYGILPNESQLQVQKTNREIEGDFTLVVFPLLKLSKKSPESTANDLGDFIVTNYTEFEKYNVVKGFLNICFDQKYWCNELNTIANTNNFGFTKPNSTGKSVMVEF